ncbi:hypothetical protein [Leptospira interrogans]|uniref:hypothetical protein n=1 Tax=Leptospira interrogans TaxID=173 RepID=UPI0007731079|nr:hypothetical protein [Leptospira interrogans]
MKIAIFSILFLLFYNILFSNSILNKIFPVALNSQERVQINELFESISKLKPLKVTIDLKFYEEKSQFSQFFGFPFSGISLEIWLKRRVTNFKIGASSEDYIANYRNGIIYLNRRFFQLSKLEQMVILIHEARHADGAEFQHIRCPFDFPYLSIRAPETRLEGMPACDDRKDGAYGFGAAFLFEIYSFGLFDENKLEEVLGMYNSEVARIILERKY